MTRLILPCALLLLSAQAVSLNQTPPELRGTSWLNTPAPATLSPDAPPLASLRGRVVIVNFWVYSCINCHNSLPTLKGWYGKFKDQELEIIGVHTPEFESDKPTANVQASLKEDGVGWPIVQDNELSNWRTWKNSSWPTFYLLDRQGRVRFVHVGEISSCFPRAIPNLEATIQKLLAEK